jgi:DNA-directed RNA polymerase beta subunit
MSNIFDTPGIESVQPPQMPKAQFDISQPQAPMPEPEGRSFSNPSEIRKAIYDNVLASAGRIPQVENTRYRMAVENPRFEKRDRFSKREVENAILSGGTIARRLRGDVVVYDVATGQPVQKRSMTVANVPYLTDEGTFIYKGNNYSLANQIRLKSGSFTRKKENGEIENHINAIPGTGTSSRILLDPETGVFKLVVQQAEIPLISLLKGIGVPDESLKEAWGEDLFMSNFKKWKDADIDRLYKKFVPRGVAKNREEQRQELAAAITKTQLDPEVTRRTLKEPFTHVSPEMLIRATRKIMAVANKDNPEYLQKHGLEPEDVDDRDALPFMRFMGQEDLLSERLEKMAPYLRQYLWKITNRNGNIDFLPSGFGDKALHAALLTSGLGSPIQSVNPAQIFEQLGRVTRMGDGGLRDTTSVPAESRNVQPSYLGYVDILSTPESLKAGVDLRMSNHIKKGKDGNLYAKMRNPNTGQLEWHNPSKVFDSTVAFPGEMKDPGRPYVAVIKNGRMDIAKREEVDYEFPAMENTMAFLTNMIPMKSGVKGQRALMGARMTSQALPLEKAESPFVQTGMPDQDDRSYEQEYAEKLGAIRAQKPGTVTAVRDGEIDVRYGDGTDETIELYKGLPYNLKTQLYQTPLVKPGQAFKPGDTLVKSNFTNDKGEIALGLNARVGYLAFEGANFEDSIAISEGMRKRLTSEHLYQHKHRINEGDKLHKNAFRVLFPGEYSKDALDKLDDTGLVRVGETVNYGDPLILTARPASTKKGVLGKGKKNFFNNATVAWDHHTPGVVTNVVKTEHGYNVAVKSVEEMQVGDKLSGRYGDKGVIAKVIPDDQMPKDSQGRPMEVLVNPLGIISRVNPSQIVEAALGKISEKTGKTYRVRDFEDIDSLVKFAKEELKKNGMSDKEDVIDPATGKKIPNVLVGNRFFMKLMHTAEGKSQGRSFGGYTAEGTPSKGGKSGSKSLGLLNINALLSHGATGFISDASTVRGQVNRDYWTEYMSGRSPKPPKVSGMYDRFLNQLRGAGIHPVREGQRLNIMGMSQKDVDELVGPRELKNVDTVDWKNNQEPKKGGLFDPLLTGGTDGNRWSFIRLPEPMPNPIMEEPMRRLLGLTEQKFNDILVGRETLRGKTGPAAVFDALSTIDLDKEVASARAAIKGGKKTARDEAIRKLKYLKAAQSTGVHPKDWFWDKVPVLPPKFRPISVIPGAGTRLIADPNFLYKEVFDSADSLKESKGYFDDVSDQREQLYNAMKAVTGLGDPTHPKHQQKQVKGILAHVFGSNPKFGVVTRKLVSSSVDLVGRAVITPDPDLDLDGVALPEDKAWEVYKPFVIRRLVRQGVPKLRAATAVSERDKIARQSLLEEMSERPVVIDRAPVLHRYGMMAFWPKLTPDSVMKINPLVVSGFGADFDGDAMQFHVPSTDDAVSDAVNKMMPSKNLFAVKNQRVHQLPSQEFLGGLWHASAKIKKDKQPAYFDSIKDVRAAFKRGEVDLDQPIFINKPD